MKLFAISDLHLAQSVDKPMDVFGRRWENHVERIAGNWNRVVSDGDAVLIGGDISWGNSLEEARLDFQLLDSLPGEKILLRGNHDYWWTTLRKMEQFFALRGFRTLHFLRNDARVIAGFYLCGTRGWVLPQDDAFTKEDEKIFNREVIRLNLSLDALKRLKQQEKQERVSIALMHYPPFTEQGAPSLLSGRLEEEGIDICLFGHIHHPVPLYLSNPEIRGVRYVLTSSDQRQFRPLLVGEDGVPGDFPEDRATEKEGTGRPGAAGGNDYA